MAIKFFVAHLPEKVFLTEFFHILKKVAFIETLVYNSHLKGVFPVTGEILRRERERKNLTVKDIEEGTSIRSAYIEALESGDFSKLPGEVYARGFLKNYANFLGLDAENLLAQFAAEIAPEIPGGENAETKPVEEKKSGVVRVTELPETNVKITRRREENRESGGSSKFIAAAIFAVVVLVGGFFYFVLGSDAVANVDINVAQTTEVNEPADNPEPEKIPENQVVATTTADKNSGGAPASAAVPGVGIQAKFSAPCWIRATVDGAVVYEGIANAGETLNWQGNNAVNIRVGNAGAVDFVMNGQSFGKLGDEGDVVDRDFTR